MKRKSKGEFWLGRGENDDFTVSHTRTKMAWGNIWASFAGPDICKRAVKRLFPYALKLKPREQIRIKATFEVMK